MHRNATWFQHGSAWVSAGIHQECAQGKELRNNRNACKKVLEHSRDARTQCWNTVGIRTKKSAGSGRSEEMRFPAVCRKEVLAAVGRKSHLFKRISFKKMRFKQFEQKWRKTRRPPPGRVFPGMEMHVTSAGTQWKCMQNKMLAMIQNVGLCMRKA